MAAPNTVDLVTKLVTEYLQVPWPSERRDNKAYRNQARSAQDPAHCRWFEATTRIKVRTGRD